MNILENTFCWKKYKKYWYFDQELSWNEKMGSTHKALYSLKRQTMNNLKQPRGFWGLWRFLVVFVIGGYTLSTVLAFDGQSFKTQKSEGDLQTTTNSPTLHTQIEDNVAFGAKKVWTNLVNFMQEGLPSEKKEEETWMQTPEFISETGKDSVKVNQPVIRMTFPESESVLLPAFEDIQNDPHKASIETLASIGLVQWGSNGKYNPKNHVRCSDFIRVMTDLYRYQNGYTLESENGLSEKKLLTLKNPDTLLAKKLNTAKKLWLLEWVDELIRDKPITPLQVKQILNNTLSLDLNLAQKETSKLIDTTKSVMTKSEMAGILVDTFQLEKPIRDSVFRDIHNHRYQDAIIQLAQLGVVAGRNGNFFPDNYVLRSDGVIMIANSMLAHQKKALVINEFYHLNTITDVTYFATFAPHLEYLLDHEIWTSLLRHEQSGNLFVPDAMLSQWEAYSLVAKAAGIKILNADSWAESKPITRGELAKLLVEAFDFTPKIQDSSLETTLRKEEEQENSVESEKKKSFLVSLLKEVVNEL